MIDIEKLKDRLGSIGDKVIIIGFIATFLNQFSINPIHGVFIMVLGGFLVYISIEKE